MEASRLDPPPELPRHSQIGERLREARQSQGLTARDVAKRIGVSPSLISQIERDKVNPSVSTLWGLVTVLGLTMSELFSEVGGPQRGPSTSLAAPPAGPLTADGSRAIVNLASGVRWERLTAETDSLVEFLFVVYPAGAASCAEDSLVRHGGKEYGYIISGRLGVRIGFDEYELGPGMALSFDSSSPHRLWAIGDEDAEAIWVVVGRQSDARGRLT
jgi:transcriptional regulator with XRE-family HTH domain